MICAQDLCGGPPGQGKETGTHKFSSRNAAEQVAAFFMEGIKDELHRKNSPFKNRFFLPLIFLASGLIPGVTVTFFQPHWPKGGSDSW